MRRLWLALLFVLLGFGVAHAASVEFTYTGYVKVRGLYFTGPAQFKFAIVNQDGSKSYWSNDGSSRNGSQPLASIGLNVIDGYFTAAMGNTLAGMRPLDPTTFNGDQSYYLRVWFNDGTHGFERLSPDQRIVNPALLGSQQLESTTIFVNPVTGDDANPGNVADCPKKTIQAAWDTIPALVNSTVTIQLQDGVYRESALLNGKTPVGGAQIVMQGNGTTPTLTRITGALEDSPTSGTRSVGLDFVKQGAVELRSLQFDYFTFAAVQARDQSQLSMINCRFTQIHRLGLQAYQSSITVRDTVFGPGVTSAPTVNGLSGSYGCYIELHNCDFDDLGVGAYLTRNSNIVTYGSRFSDLAWGGVYVFANSSATFWKPNTIMERATWGVLAESNSDVSYVTSNITYSQMSSQNFILSSGSINIQN